MKISNMFLMLKQGIKGVFKFKVQFVIIALLTFLSTFVLSISLTTETRLRDSYNQIVKPIDRFAYSGTTRLNSTSDETDDPLLLPMLLNNMDATSLGIVEKDGTKKEPKGAYNWVFNNPNDAYTGEENHVSFLTKATRQFIDDVKNGNNGLSASDFFSSAVSNVSLNDSGSTKLFSYYLTYLFWELDKISDEAEKNTPLNQIKSNVGDDETIYSPIGLFTYHNPRWYTDEINIEYLKDDVNHKNVPTVSLNVFDSLYGKKNGSVFRDVYYGLAYLVDLQSQMIKEFNTNSNIVGTNESIALNAGNCPAPKYSITTNGQAIAFLFGEDVGNTILPSENNWIVGDGKAKPYSLIANVDANDVERDKKITFAESKQVGDAIADPEAAIWYSGLRGISNPIINNQVIEQAAENNFSNLANWDWYSYIDFSRNVNVGGARLFASIELQYDEPTSDYFVNDDFKKLANGDSKGSWDGLDNSVMWNAPILDIYLTYNKIVSSALNFDYGFRREFSNYDTLNQVSFRTIIVDDQNNDKAVSETPTKYGEDYNFKIIKGTMPSFKQGEVAINQQFADKNNLHIGDVIQIINTSFIVKAIAVDAFSYLPGQDINVPIPNAQKTAFIWVDRNGARAIDHANWSGGSISSKSIIDTLCYFLWDKENNNASLEARKNVWYALFSNSKNDLLNNTRVAREYVDNNGNISNDLVAKSSNLQLVKFDKSIFKYSWTVLPTVLKTYDAIVYTASAVIALIAVIALVISVKKTVEYNSKQIGILKALGEDSKAISVSYIAQSLIIAFAIVPISWIIGTLCQSPFIALFKGWFAVFTGTLLFDWIPFVISFAALGLLSGIVSYLTAYVLTRKPMLEILQTSVKWGKLSFLEWMKRTVFKKWSFRTRFSVTLTSSGYKQISLMSVVMLLASFLIGISISLPAILARVNSTYYAAIKYANKYSEIPPVGNQPLSKTAVSYWDGQKYADSQFASNKYLPDGYYKDPAVYYSTVANSSIVSQYIYDANDKRVHDSYTYMLKDYQNLVQMITYYVGSNLYNNQGVGISVGMLDAVYGALVHDLDNPIKSSSDKAKFDSNSSENGSYSDDERQSYAGLVGNALITQLPAILSQVFRMITKNGTVQPEGNTWKDKVLSVIVTELPSFVKNYVDQSASRKEQFGVTFQNEIYIPGQETLATTISDPNQNIRGKVQNVTVTGLDNTQDSIIINNNEHSKIYLSDEDKQTNIFDKLNVPTTGIISSNADEITIPVLANRQAESAYNLKPGKTLDDWQNNLSLLKIKIGNDAPVVLPTDAWVYDDDDYANWLKINSKQETPYTNTAKYDSSHPNDFWTWSPSENEHHYIDASKIPEGKLSYSPEFTADGSELVNKALMFKEFMYDDDGKPIGTYLRPMYQYKQMRLMIPEDWVSEKDVLWNGKDPIFTQNKAATKNWYQSNVNIKDIPQSVIDSYKRLTINHSSLKLSNDTKWLVINPYDLAYFNDEEPSDPFTIFANGTPYWMKYILQNGSLFSVDTSSTLREYLLSMGANPNIKINLENKGTINSYNDKLIVMDQDIANFLMGYKNTREYQYNYQVFDRSTYVPAGTEDSKHGKSVFDRWKVQDPNTDKFRYNLWTNGTYDKNDVWEPHGFALAKDKTILDYAPHSFYNTKFSNIDEPLNLSSSVSFTQATRIGQSSINKTTTPGDVNMAGAGVNSAYPSIVESQDLLSTTRALTDQITLLVVSIGLMLIIAIIITAALLTMMTGDVYIEQYSRFMVLLRALGYSNWTIAGYTFGTVTVISLVAWALGTILAWVTIFGVVKAMWAAGLAIPVGISWWPILVSFVILAAAYIGSLAVSSYKTRHTNPSLVLTATAE